MKALVLNSGLGTRMGEYVANVPKCMISLSEKDTIISRQLKQLVNMGISEVVLTTGPFEEVLKQYVESLKLPIKFIFVNNPLYMKTNYIYSIFLAKEWLNDDIILLHGDLVFEDKVLSGMIATNTSCMAVSSTCSLPYKDFKAVVSGEKIVKVGIEFFDSALAAQPAYILKKPEWNLWLSKISDFCSQGNTKCYAENALNMITDENFFMYPFDYKNMLCQEVDNEIDLLTVRAHLEKLI